MLRPDRRRSNLIPSQALLSGPDLFVGSLEKERLGAGPRTLCWSLTMIIETIKARLFGLSMKILEILE